MSKIRGAYARQKMWVGISCDECGSHYSCLVEGFGQSDDTFFPFSDDSLKEMAISSLNLDMQKKATSLPCPKCGIFPESHVNRVRSTMSKVISWTLTGVLFMLMLLLIVSFAPKTPAWLLLIVIAISLILPLFFISTLVDKFDPNRNIERNRQLAHAKIAGGKMRIQSKTVDSNPPADLAPNPKMLNSYYNSGK